MRPRLALVLCFGLALAAVVAPVAAAAQPSAAPSSVPSGPAVVVSNGPRNAPRVALTFDDGSGTPICQTLVDILVATQTPATFFPSARWAAGSPELWHEIAALGFPVGNHTAHHENLAGLTLAAQTAEIVDDRTAMEAAMGAPMAPLFRPPYGSYDATTVAAATAAGNRYVVLWDTTFADSSKRPNGKPWPLTSYIRSAEKGTNGSILLGHCGDPVDPMVVAQVIADYRARGFTFVTVPQLLGMPGAQAMTFASPTPSAGGSASPSAPSSPPLVTPSAALTASPVPAPSQEAVVASPVLASQPAPGAAASPLPAGLETAAPVAALLALGAVVALVILVAVIRRRGRASSD